MPVRIDTDAQAFDDEVRPMTALFSATARFALASAIAVATAAPLALGQSVLVVDDDAGAPGVFATVQAAVDAAQPGDTVAVRPGFYGDVVLGAKTLTLLGVPAADGTRPKLTLLEVQGTGPADRVVARGLDLTGSVGVRVESAAGPVLLEDLFVGQRLVVAQSQLVAIVRGDVDGGADFADSHVDLFDTSIFGKPSAGTGLVAQSCSVYATGCTIGGGKGNDGLDAFWPIPVCSNGTPGGIGIHAVDSSLVLRNTSYFGGVGGAAGTPDPGFPPCSPGSLGPSFVGAPPPVQVPITAPGHRTLASVGVAQEPDPIVLKARGAEGEDLLLYVSTGLGSLYLPTLSGPLVADAGLGFFFPAATLPAGGLAELSFTIAVPAPLQTLQLAVQGLFVHPSGAGPNYVGDPTWVQIVADDVPLVDCDLDGVSDPQQVLAGTATDCDQNGVLDACEIASGDAIDCNGNGIPDACDLASGASLDANGDGVPDECGQALHVPSAYPTIGAALAAANDGDAIVLADGVYSGPGNTALDAGSKYVTIRSASGPAACTVDLVGTHRFLYVYDAPSTTVVQGITFAGGGDFDPFAELGSALRTVDASLVVDDCVFVGCRGDKGGAIRFDVATTPPRGLEVKDSRFVDCRASFAGGAIFASAVVTSGVVLDRCSFEDNAAGSASGQWGQGGAVALIGSAGGFQSVLASVRNSLFGRNRSEGGGGAIELASTSLDMVGCTFAGNVAAGPSSGGGALRAASSSVSITNSVFADGAAAGPGAELWFAASVTAQGGFFVKHSLVGGGAGSVEAAPGAPALAGSVVDADPLFFGPLDQHLLPGSPAIDAGDPAFAPAPGELDLDGAPRVQGAAVDMGCYETTP